MTLAQHVSKGARRLAHERPYGPDNDASLVRAMERGIQPKGLPALLRWFREVIHEEAPITVHKAEVWRDYGHDGSGGSALGAPAWSDPFRRFLEAVDYPSVLDEDGYYRFPLRAALSRVARRHPLTARALYQLALMDGDWRMLAERMSYPDEFMEMYIERALFTCWRECSDVRLRT